MLKVREVTIKFCLCFIEKYCFLTFELLCFVKMSSEIPFLTTTLFQIYPHGSSGATDGYMSVYFALAQGVNDDNLQWPFLDQVIRMAVVDQASDVLSRMDSHNSYITTTDSGSVWDKPTSVPIFLINLTKMYSLLKHRFKIEKKD